MTDDQWERLCQTMGEGPWLEQRFSTMAARYDSQDELDSLIGTWTKGQDARKLMHRLQEAGVPAAMVQNARDRVEDDPQLREREFYTELDHPQFGRRKFEGMPARLSDTPAELHRAGPVLGQQSDFVLGHILGLGDDEIAQMAAEAVW